MLPLASSKVCACCREEYPRNDTYFTPDPSMPDGYRPKCANCRSAQSRKKHMRMVRNRVRKLDKASMAIIDAIAERGTAVPHIAEVFQRLMDAYGGAAGLARHHMAQYLSSKPGSQIRQRMIEGIIKLSIKVTDHGGARKPVEMMDDEELEREYQQRFLQATAKLLPYEPKEDDADSEGEARARVS